MRKKTRDLTPGEFYFADSPSVAVSVALSDRWCVHFIPSSSRRKTRITQMFFTLDHEREALGGIDDSVQSDADRDKIGS